MPEVTIGWYVALSVALFSIGALGVLVRRNAIIIFMSIELMLNSIDMKMMIAFRRMSTPNEPMTNKMAESAM